MRWRPALRRTAKWTLTALAISSAALWAATIRGDFSWNNEPALCSFGADKGMAVVAWVPPTTIDSMVNKVASLPALPPGEEGARVLERYRVQLRNHLAWEVKMTTAHIERWQASTHLWWPVHYMPEYPDVRAAAIPIWSPLAVLGPPTLLLWGLHVCARLRGRAGCCRKCGYDRRGLKDDAVCPECGKPATPAALKN